MTQQNRMKVVHAFVVEQMEKRPAATIIAMMVERYGASHKHGPQTNTLSCAGVRASCTWSKDGGLLEAWRKSAARKIAALDAAMAS